MPATETVALVTGIIGCATSLVTIAPRFREPLQKCYRDLVEKISYMQDTESRFHKLDNEIIVRDTVQGVITVEEMEFMDSVHVDDFDCLFGYLPNYYRRYTIGKRLAVIKGRLNQLGVHLKPGGTGKQERVMLTEYFRRALFPLHHLIQDHDKIGVSGPIGIGKTKIVEHFHYVGSIDRWIWVEASYEDDVKTLQKKLASKIGLSLPSNATVPDNATLLRKSLTKSKRGVIVLDNLLKPFSLEEIGIPIENKGQKIILISRSSSVCRQMGSQKIIELKLLSDEDAYDLLKRELDPHDLRILSDETQSMLKHVAEECGGLPLAITMVAQHLRKLNWNDQVTIETALKNQLDAFSESPGDVKYINNNVFENFVLHYEQLKNSNYSCTQECFLWCTIYPRNTTFVAKELMEYWMWEGLLGEVERIDKKMREAKEIMDELKDASFLHSTGNENGEEIVKLHPFIWDMAVQMIKGSPKFFIKAGRRLRKPIYRDWPENVERVSLMSNDIKELRSGPNFCKLSTLLLQCNPIDLPIHNAFFNSIPNLKILNLSNTGVRVLPESLSCLKNLIALLLRNCLALISLPSLSGLMALTVLDISGSPIAELSCGTSSELLRLDLSRTGVRNFPPSFLIKHYNLQELLMIGCDFTWISRSPMQDDSAACIEDLENLKYLSVLGITFSNMQTFFDYINRRKRSQLKSFKFCVGGLYNGNMGNNSLAFIKEFPSDTILLPDNTFELLVMHCGDVTHLTISRFQYLKIMDISYCANLKYLFKLEDLQHLQNLKEMVIAHCPAMKKVIEKDEEEVIEREEQEGVIDQVALPKLQKLTLFDLPQLRFICQSKIKCDSLQTIAVWSCSELRTFLVLLQPGLKEVIGESSWFENLEQCPTNELSILRKLFVEKSPPEELISRMMAPSDS